MCEKRPVPREGTPLLSAPLPAGRESARSGCDRSGPGHLPLSDDRKRVQTMGGSAARLQGADLVFVRDFDSCETISRMR